MLNVLCADDKRSNSHDTDPPQTLTESTTHRASSREPRDFGTRHSFFGFCFESTQSLVDSNATGKTLSVVSLFVLLVSEKNQYAHLVVSDLSFITEIYSNYFLNLNDAKKRKSDNIKYYTAYTNKNKIIFTYSFFAFYVILCHGSSLCHSWLTTR